MTTPEPNQSMEPHDWHALGTRDAAASLFYHIRRYGERPFLRALARQLAREDNPHAQWYLENHPDQC